MLIPYNVDVPMQRWPLANWAIIAATIFLGAPVWTNLDEYEGSFLLLWRDEDFHWSQLIGSLLGHADFIHLAGNMFFLFVFGNAVNAKVGHVLFPLLYLMIGVGESLIWIALGSGPATIGASGAVMGVIGCFLALYPRNDVSIFYWFGLLGTGTFSISSYWVILCYVALDLWGLSSTPDSGVNYLAHAAGAAIGFALTLLLVATRIVQTDPGEQTLLDILLSKDSKPPNQRPSRPNPPRSPRSSLSQRPPAASRPAPRKNPGFDDSPIPLADDFPTPDAPNPPKNPT
jgi:membrane associated rhomboid family serine protease